MKFVTILLALPTVTVARPFRSGFFLKNDIVDLQRPLAQDGQDLINCLLVTKHTQMIETDEDGTEHHTGTSEFNCEIRNDDGHLEFVQIVGLEDRLKKMTETASSSVESASTDVETLFQSGATQLSVKRGNKARLENSQLIFSNGDDDDDDDDGLDLIDRFSGTSLLFKDHQGRPFADRDFPDVFATPLQMHGIGSNGHDRRHLAVSAIGSRSTLVVRPTFGKYSASQLSAAVFGTGWTLRTGMQTCSFGQLDMRPATWTGTGSQYVQGGVISVNIGTKLTTTDRNKVMQQLWYGAEAMLGLGNGQYLETSFDHVMFAIPAGTSGSWVAEGWMNSWATIFNDQWILSPTAQMHEIGHNLNLEHSGEGTSQYGDNSGEMGTSHNQQGGPRMCYNPAKSYQLGWYSKQQLAWDPTTQGPLATRLLGVVEYTGSTASKFDNVVVKVGTYYIGYNKKTSFNDGTQEGADLVNVVQQSADGQISWAVARLTRGSSYTIKAFSGNKDLIIQWTGMSQSRPYVDIYFNGGPRAAAMADVPAAVAAPLIDPSVPTDAPVAPPTDVPIAPVAPPTDAPVVPVVPPTDSPVVPPTDAPVVPPTDAPVVPPTDAPVVPPTDAPVAPPTDAPAVVTTALVETPTDAPVAPPTDAPVAVAPTDAPVVPPTDAPVVPPSDAPIVVAPTDAPVVPPTDAPVVVAPTDAPVVPPTDAPIVATAAAAVVVSVPADPVVVPKKPIVPQAPAARPGCNRNLKDQQPRRLKANLRGGGDIDDEEEEGSQNRRRVKKAKNENFDNNC